MPEGSKIVITDARFKNKLDLVRNAGGQIYRVKRGPDPAWFDDATNASKDAAALDRMMKSGIHESEWRWIDYEFDGVINNDGSLDELRRVVAVLAK
jgi:hypothetical protein